MWRDATDANDKRRYLTKAIEHYERGALLDLNLYYCSGNLPALYRARGKAGDEERARSAAARTVAACERARALGRGDEWLKPTLLVAAFDAADAATAGTLLDEIREGDLDAWKIGSVVDSLRLSLSTRAGRRCTPAAGAHASRAGEPAGKVTSGAASAQVASRRGSRQDARDATPRRCPGALPSFHHHRDVIMRTPTTSPTSLTSPLKSLLDYGQSVWLDYIRRDLIPTGELKRLVDEDGLRGMTSNPAIFEKAITGANDYRGALSVLGTGRSTRRRRCTNGSPSRTSRTPPMRLRPVYDAHARTRRLRQPRGLADLAHDTEGTIDEARRLWATVDAAQRHDQGARHAGGPAGASSSSSPRASTSTSRCSSRSRRVRAGGRGLHRGARGRASRRAATSRGSPASPASSSAASTPRSTSRVEQAARTTDGRRPNGARLEACWARSRSPTPSSPTSATRRSSAARAGRRWRARAPAAAPAVGEHQHQEPGVPRRDVRRGADRPRHGQHGAAGDVRRLPRPRQAARRAWSRTSTARAATHGRRWPRSASR